jgi:hypothetical protein
MHNHDGQVVAQHIQHLPLVPVEQLVRPSAFRLPIRHITYARVSGTFQSNSPMIATPASSSINVNARVPFR